MKVALVHDYLREFGGAERVLEALHNIFPEAPIYTAYLNLEKLGPHSKRVKDWQIITSWMQKVPFANKLISPFRIFAPLMFESFDLKEFDVVISSCNLYSSKAVLTKPQSFHLSYIHTPPKMLYGYTTSFNYRKQWWTRIGGELANHFLRVYDFEISQRPDVLIANSQNVADRIKKFYRRDSLIIYPPTDITQYLKVKKTQGEYYIAISRLVRGKGLEIIIEACSQLDVPLKVVGIGPELENLKTIAGKNVEFVGAVDETEKVELLAGAKALIVATEQEDFGITPVESMATGTPVIAAKSGGYLETVIEGKTGEFFEITQDLGESKQYVDKKSVENLVEVLKNFKPQKYLESDCRKQAQNFSEAKFKDGILQIINKNIKNSSN